MSDTVDLNLCMHNALFKSQALLISDCHDQKNSVIVRGAHQHKFWYWSHLWLWLLLLLPCLCLVLILIWNFIFQSELVGAAWRCRPPFSRMHWLWSSSLSSSSSSSSSHQQSAQTDSLMSWPFHRVTGTWGIGDEVFIFVCIRRQHLFEKMYWINCGRLLYLLREVVKKRIF